MRRQADPLAAYNGLIDCADVHGWITYLGTTKEGGWWLEVREKRELLARARGQTLNGVGRMCGRTLERSGRLEA